MPVKMTHYTWTTTTAVFLDVFLLGFLVIAPKCSALSGGLNFGGGGGDG